METIGFIGLGRIGTAMAINIQKAGYPMVVHDAREAATRPLLDGGARLAVSPEEVARASEITLTSLPSPIEVEEVITGPEGVLAGIKPGSVYLDLSTCGPDLLRSLEHAFQEKGAHIMDTPVLSTPAWAAEGKLIVMAGGEKEVFDRVHPVLEAFSDKVVYTGTLGTANVCKLANNLVNLVTAQVVAEALTLGIKSGVELDVLMQTGSRNALGLEHEALSQTVFQDRFQPPRFTLALALKDIALATELGRRSGVPLPVTNFVEQLQRQAVNRGWAEDDRAKLYLLQEEAAGVKIRATT